jgi:hypothetical protein
LRPFGGTAVPTDKDQATAAPSLEETLKRFAEHGSNLDGHIRRIYEIIGRTRHNMTLLCSSPVS